MFKIIDNMQAPVSATTRTRTRGEFSQALDGLQVGQGFEYPSKGTLKSQYPRIAPKKFGGRRFKVWAVEGQDGMFGVRREADRLVADAVPDVNTTAPADFDENDGGDDE